MPAERIPLALLLDTSQQDLRTRIATSIRAGAVFVYPTETIYGIGGIMDARVENRILIAKGRPRENPMIVIAGRRETLQGLGARFPKAADTLAQRFWPGNLTLVVPCGSAGGTIAVRVANHPFVRYVDELLGLPIYSTSANISGLPYVGDPDAIYGLFEQAVDFMIDGGVLPASLPSSVVRVDEGGMVTVLREGAVPLDEIKRAVP